MTSQSTRPSRFAALSRAPQAATSTRRVLGLRRVFVFVFVVVAVRVENAEQRKTNSSGQRGSNRCSKWSASESSAIIALARFRLLCDHLVASGLLNGAGERAKTSTRPIDPRAALISLAEVHAGSSPSKGCERFVRLLGRVVRRSKAAKVAFSSVLSFQLASGCG